MDSALQRKGHRCSARCGHPVINAGDFEQKFSDDEEDNFGGAGVGGFNFLVRGCHAHTKLTLLSCAVGR